GQPFPLPPVPTDAAYLAYEKVLDFAGVDMDKRDLVDTNIVYKVRTQTGALINTPTVSPVWTTTQPYLDTDQDGIPDFWEITFGQPPYVPSNNNSSQNAPGYTTLEEYNNWLAGPHALTVTTNPVDVDLQQMFGEAGQFYFSVANGVQGVVYLTNVLAGVMTNTGPLPYTVAVFTPTNSAGAATNYSGYASFDVNVINTATLGSFGPVTVSVVASAVPVATNNDLPPMIVTLTDGVPYANTNYGGSDYYEFTVTNSGSVTRLSEASFSVTNASGPVALVASYGLPLPSLSSFDYVSSNSWKTQENIQVFSSSTPVALTNGVWFLAVVNVAGSNVNYSVTATNLFSLPAPLFLFPTNTDVFTNLETHPFSISCVATDLNNPPLPLTFALVSGPTNLTVSSGGLINWSPTEFQGPTTNGPATNTILVSVSNGIYFVTNSFTIIVMASNLPPVFVTPNPPNQVVPVPGGTLVFNNSAINLNQPDYPLAYSLINPPIGATIDSTAGIITWSPPAGLAGYNFLFTTVATDTDPLAFNDTSASVTNSFLAFVEPGIVVGPPNTNSVSSGGINWLAITVPTNAIAATNTLVFATNRPVNVWFSPDVPPAIGSPDDFKLLTNSTQGVSVLTTNSTPAITPGGTYFLGVQNTNSVAVGYALQVNFLLATPPNIPPVFVTPNPPNQVVVVPGGTLLVTNSAIDLNQPEYPLAYALINPPSGAAIDSTAGIITWSPPAVLAGYDFLFTTVVTDRDPLALSDTSASTTNSFLAYVEPGIIVGSPNANSVSSGGINWLAITAPTNAIAATNTLVFATNQPVNMWFSANVPPNVTSANDFKLLTNSTHGVSLLTTNSTPAIVPGNVYFLGVQNTNSAAVGYALQVNFLLATPPNPVPISGILATNIGGTNSFVLTWLAPVNDSFQVRWATNLIPPIAWTTFPGVISSTNGSFIFMDPTSPLVMKFYQLMIVP
ncbi:MAG: hypothetical protein ABSE48_06980, partial [Verrucomicrobiota bacterium]